MPNPAHGGSFLRSDESDLLTIALFSRAMRVNRLQAIFNMSDFEQKRVFPTLIMTQPNLYTVCTVYTVVYIPRIGANLISPRFGGNSI